MAGIGREEVRYIHCGRGVIGSCRMVDGGVYWCIYCLGGVECESRADAKVVGRMTVVHG